MANQEGKDPTVDLQALLTRAKDMTIDTTPISTTNSSLADSIYTLQSQVAQIMTVQLEKFEEIVRVVNSMKQAFKQLDIKVDKVQAEMNLLKEKLTDQNKLHDKIQADRMVSPLQRRLEKLVVVSSSLKRKLEGCQESDSVSDRDEDSGNDKIEVIETKNSGDEISSKKTDSTTSQLIIGETARYVYSTIFFSFFFFFPYRHSSLCICTRPIVLYHKINLLLLYFL